MTDPSIRPCRAKRPPTKWTDEMLAAEASRYKTRGAFDRGSASAYRTAWQRGCLERICAHMPRLRSQKYAKADVCRIARQFSSREAFRHGAQGAYDAAHRNGWLDEACEHILRQRAKRYTLERVIEVAKPYRTRAKFQRMESGAYGCARANGWLEIACAHMNRIGNRALRVVYRIWNDDTKEVYIGLSFDWRERYKNHLRKPAIRVRSLLRGQHQVEAITDILPAMEASRIEAAVVEEYRAAGWAVLNNARAGALGSSPRKWTLETLRAEALKYATRSEMWRDSKGAYSAARDLRLIDAIFADHENLGYRHIRFATRRRRGQPISPKNAPRTDE